jgi:hypothetical protein
MYHEEQPPLRPLPLESFRPFTQDVRTVDNVGLVQIEGSYGASTPKFPQFVNRQSPAGVVLLCYE